MFSSRKRILISGVLLLSLLGSMGCAARKPAPPPSPGTVASEFKEEPTIRLYDKETGTVRPIKMEEYVAGVVAAEMNPSWPVEALAAQAILARTFTLEAIKNRGGMPKYQADASTEKEEFQAYDAKKINDRVKQAVANTRGMVVRYQGNYVHAWFHADSGGKTALAMEGLEWNKDATPYIQVVNDPGVKVSPPENKNWVARIPLSVVARVVKDRVGQDPGRLNAGNVKILDKGPSGRATRIQLGRETISGPTLRLALGSEKMRSTLLTGLTVEGNNLVIRGNGFGHGVGMSQYGAKLMAEEGKKAEEIVRYYYKDVSVDKLWP